MPDGACVLEAISALSLQSSPMPHDWPAFIEHPFLSMQRVPCVATAKGTTVAQLWSRGGGGGVEDATVRPLVGGVGEGAALPWAYVPVFGFLKQFPAHAPGTA